MTRRTRFGAAVAAIGFITTLILSPPSARASIPDADARSQVNQGGIGMISGVYGHADFGLSDKDEGGWEEYLYDREDALCAVYTWGSMREPSEYHEERELEPVTGH